MGKKSLKGEKSEYGVKNTPGKKANTHPMN